ncbi:MAG: THUMP domain-containing protein [Candidatus Thorarchaeota archaeon]
MEEGYLFNLVVGCPHDRERAAGAEVKYFIGDLLDDPQLVINRVGVPGIVTCHTALDPFDVTHRLRTLAKENPYQFRYALRFTPIERCVPTSVDKIISAVEQVRHRIAADESFRVTIRRRGIKFNTTQLIDAVASLIPARVDLSEPDKHLWIEIVGDLTGVSVLSPLSDIFSAATLQMESDNRLSQV